MSIKPELRIDYEGECYYNGPLSVCKVELIHGLEMELLSLNIRTALHLMHLDKCRSSRTKRCCGRYFYRFRGENETSVPYSLGCSLHTLPITLNIFILLFASIAKVRRSINCPPTLDEYMYTCISSSAYTAQTDQSTIGIHRVAPVTAGREHSVSWDVS